jgi:hypothetical protein
MSTDLGTAVAASKHLLWGAIWVQELEETESHAGHVDVDCARLSCRAASSGLASAALAGRSCGGGRVWGSGGSEGHGENSDDGLELHVD